MQLNIFSFIFFIFLSEHSTKSNFDFDLKSTSIACGKYVLIHLVTLYVSYLLESTPNYNCFLSSVCGGEKEKEDFQQTEFQSLL